MSANSYDPRFGAARASNSFLSQGGSEWPGSSAYQIPRSVEQHIYAPGLPLDEVQQGGLPALPNEFLHSDGVKEDTEKMYMETMKNFSLPLKDGAVSLQGKNDMIVPHEADAEDSTQMPSSSIQSGFPNTQNQSPAQEFFPPVQNQSSLQEPFPPIGLPYQVPLIGTSNAYFQAPPGHPTYSQTLASLPPPHTPQGGGVHALHSAQVYPRSHPYERVQHLPVTAHSSLPQSNVVPSAQVWKTHDDVSTSLPETQAGTRLRRRTTAAQLKKLEETFSEMPKPPTHLRRKLGEELDMSVRAVQVWFQNRRAKAKFQSRHGTSTGPHGLLPSTHSISLPVSSTSSSSPVVPSASSPVAVAQSRSEPSLQKELDMHHKRDVNIHQISLPTLASESSSAQQATSHTPKASERKFLYLLPSTYSTETKQHNGRGAKKSYPKPP